MIVKVDKALLDALSIEALSNPRKRKHYNFHKDYDEPVQRLLNAIEPGSYIRPHIHINPDKLEIFFVLRGRFVVIIFNEDGSIREHHMLDASEEKLGIEVHPGEIHMIAALEPGSVAYEIKNGPFVESTDKNFADFAPKEGTPEGAAYLDGLLTSLGL